MYFSFLFGIPFGKNFDVCYPPKGSEHLLSFPFSDGKFGAYMQVHIQNDGPVTIELESPAATVDPKQVSDSWGLSGKADVCPLQICSIPVVKQYSFHWVQGPCPSCAASE